MQSNSKVKLNNGLEMPLIGLGTFLQKNVEEVVYESIKSGTRLIDTASIYECEPQVGKGINRAIEDGLCKREDLFVVTKLWIWDKPNPEAALRRQLKDLNLEYVDLYLDHWPMFIYEHEGKSHKAPLHLVWKKLEALVNMGLTKSIGVSNYNVQTVMDLLSFCEIKPVVNQIEINPFLPRVNLCKYCKDNGVEIMAYNSLCKNSYTKVQLLDEKDVKQLAEKYSTSPGIIALSWATSQGFIVIPGTSSTKRMQENLKVLSITLSDDEIKKLNELKQDIKGIDPKDSDITSYIDLFA